MVEYLLTAAVLLSIVAVMAVFLFSVKEQGGRVLNLVASDYP